MSVPSLVYAHVYGQASFSNKKRPKTVPLPLHLIFSYFLCALYYSYRWRKSLCLISLRNFLPQLDDAYQVNRRQRVPELTAFRTFHDIRLSPFAVLVQTGTAQPETSKDSGTQPNGPPPVAGTESLTPASVGMSAPVALRTSLTTRVAQGELRLLWWGNSTPLPLRNCMPGRVGLSHLRRLVCDRCTTCA
ncbi:hypothetical protein HDK90DRAFT_90684 [Phyllosticta capitalensis]|uniref:Uncharacterized protein n=1 Tax=Phyllosticta capitalensis TaxID=121624 RepID=A0ABR1YC03_9PEZI